MKKNLIITILAIALLSMGCGTSPEEFIKKVENPENGLRTETQTTNYKYTLQYCPYDYMYVQDNISGNITTRGFEERKKDLEGLTYFILYVDNLEGTKNIDRATPQFGTFYDYFSSYFEFAVELRCEGKTLPCSLFHAEGLYGIQSGIRIHLGFENVCQVSDMHLRFVNELDSPQPIELTITKASIENRPQYKF